MKESIELQSRARLGAYLLSESRLLIVTGCVSDLLLPSACGMVYIPLTKMDLDLLSLDQIGFVNSEFLEYKNVGV